MNEEQHHHHHSHPNYDRDFHQVILRLDRLIRHIDYLRDDLKHKRADRLSVRVTEVSKQKERRMFEGTCHIPRDAIVSVTPTADDGSPQKVDGAVVFTATAADGSELEIIQIDDTSARIVMPETAQDVTVNLAADADRGEGVRTITASGTIHVVDQEASTLGVSVNEVDKTTTPPPAPPTPPTPAPAARRRHA